jgi:class 3 adenylate cyclase
MSSAPAASLARRDRLTLRFADPATEAAYQRDAAANARRGLQSGTAAAVGLWAIAGLATPGLLDVEPTLIWLIAVVMIIANAAGYLLVGAATTADQQHRIGVVLNVSAAAGILTIVALIGEFERFASPTLMLLSIYAFLILRLPSPLSIVTGIGYLLAYIAMAVLTPGVDPRAATLGLLLLGGAVGVGIVGSYLLEDAQRSLFASRQEIAALHAQVDGLFRQYLSPDVATALIDDPHRSALGGEVGEVTVLFADLAGFTPFSERTAPADVVALLNTYFGVTVPIVLHEGGTVTQFVGDALMAIFNAPVRQADHAVRAARTALAFQGAVDGIAADVAGRPRFRVGINTGPALIGNIGSDQLRNFAAIGDTTNLAARLQTFAAPGQVVIGARTRDLLGGAAAVRPLGELELKGKSTGTAAFELLGLHATSAVAVATNDEEGMG